MIDIETNPLYYAATGGIILGIATSLNYTLRGKVTGMSGMIYGVASLNKKQIPEKIGIIGGMLAMSGLFFLVFQYQTFNGFSPYGPKQDILKDTSYLGFALAGLLVGFGTKLSNGCTSGHGLCGIARFSIRSLVAVITFLTAAIAISTLRHYVTLGPFSSKELNPPIQYNHTVSASFFLATGLLLPIIAGFYKLILVYEQRQEKNRNGASAAQNSNIQTMQQKDQQIGKAVLIDQIITFVVGVLFGIGLLVAGMIRRVNIMSFLEMGEGWNPSLLFVLGCGILINIIFFTYMRKVRKHPFFGGQLFDPNNTTIDIPLILGSACFGLGWGIGGICPGPAIMMISVWNIPIHLIWLTTLLIGMFLANLIDKLVFSKQPDANQKEQIVDASNAIANAQMTPDIKINQDISKDQDSLNNIMVKAHKMPDSQSVYSQRKQQHRQPNTNQKLQKQKIVPLRMFKKDHQQQIKIDKKSKDKKLVQQNVHIAKTQEKQNKGFDNKDHAADIEDF